MMIYREDNALTGETIFYDNKGNIDIFPLKNQLQMKKLEKKPALFDIRIPYYEIDHKETQND